MARPQRTSAAAARIRGRRAVRLERPRIRLIEQQYAVRVLQYIGMYRDYVEPKVFAILDYIGEPERPVRVRQDEDAHDIIYRTFGNIKVGIERLLTESELKKVAGEGALAVDQASRDLLRRQYRTVLKVDPLMSEPWLLPEVERFVTENVALISSVPTENLADIEQMLYRDAKRKQSPAQMKKNIEEQFGVAESRAALIARDQVGKFNGALTELRQTNLGIKSYVWRTSEDERVRPDHAKLDGHTYKWDDPPVTVTTGKRAGERNHPGQDIQCRCYPEPVLDHLLK